MQRDREGRPEAKEKDKHQNTLASSLEETVTPESA